MSNLKSRLLILLLLAATVAMLADLSTAPRSKFTAANYERLEIDMMFDETTAILGEPDYIDTSQRDMQWVTWFSPFDLESSILALFVYPSGKLYSIERQGHLPDRPLLIREVLPKRETPSFILKLLKHEQDQERRATMMLDPKASVSNAPFLP